VAKFAWLSQKLGISDKAREAADDEDQSAFTAAPVAYPGTKQTTAVFTPPPATNVATGSPIIKRHVPTPTK